MRFDITQLACILANPYVIWNSFNIATLSLEVADRTAKLPRSKNEIGVRFVIKVKKSQEARRHLLDMSYKSYHDEED